MINYRNNSIWFNLRRDRSYIFNVGIQILFLNVYAIKLSFWSPKTKKGQDLDGNI